MTIQIVCFVLINQLSRIQSNQCPGENGKICCSGFKWNDAHGKCLPCEKGYHGTNCSSKCPFPWYGVNCMSNCNCSETDCDHVYGCVKFQEACEQGYRGTNCSSKCPFPWYGVNCMSNCNCSETDCDHVYGCVKSQEANVTATDDIADFLTIFSKREMKPFIHKLNGFMYPIIGLAAVSVLLIILYICTHLLEKC